ETRTRPQWSSPESRELLKEAFGGKCAYCESDVTVTGDGVVDHFRPKRVAIDLDGATFPGYWWLTYAWENLYLACAHCNRNKGSRFPVAGVRATGPDDALLAEAALLLDPCLDEPADHFVFDDKGYVASCSGVRDGYDRGAITIDTLGLNRGPLVLARKVAV